MPSAPQPCSSSPISVRLGSADSVVLPVPERPKKMALSPSGATLAEQCIGIPPPGGQIIVHRRKLSLLLLADIISPADQDDLAGEVDRDDVLRTHAMPFGI